MLRRHQIRNLRPCAPWGRLKEPCAVSRGDDGYSRPLAGNDHTAGRGGIVTEVLRLGSDERALLARPGVDVVAPSLTDLIGPLETVVPGQHGPRTLHRIALTSIGRRDRLGGRTASQGKRQCGNEESGAWWHRSCLPCVWVSVPQQRALAGDWICYHQSGPSPYGSIRNSHYACHHPVLVLIIT